MPTAAVIGAGPVGCLTALGLAQRGYEVTLYEIRPEEAFIGTSLQSNARSINLAISTRGLTALSFIDPALADAIIDVAVPMRARMIHPKPLRSLQSDPKTAVQIQLQSQIYSVKGDCINSVSRNLLNRTLLDHVIDSGISICWSHKLVRANLDGSRKQKEPSGAADGSASTTSTTTTTTTTTTTSTSSFSRSDGVDLIFDSPNCKGIQSTTDLLIGCDGHHSKVRGEIGRVTEMDFSQRYIDNYYSELHIPKGANDDYVLDPNHLHIWPRRDFLLIALPNRDKSFTSTLFAPKSVYANHFNQENRLVTFFENEFPDVVDLIGRDNLIQDLLGKKPSSLSTIECKPYHYKGKAIVLGDAAHAMVPFYGQGLNCGLEDVRIMFELIDKQLSQKRFLGVEEVGEPVAASASSSRSTSPWSVNHIRVDSGADVSGKRAAAVSHQQAAFQSANKLPNDAILNVLREHAFDEYTQTRRVDLVAISQLALDNYEEMSSKVISRTFLFRKRLDAFLVRHLPSNWWDSLYALVTFSNIGYHEAQRRENRQKQILNAFGLTTLVSFSAMGIFGYRSAKGLGLFR